MNCESTPPSAQPSSGYLSEEAHKIITSTFTCVTALILFVNYFIGVTRFRLWHSNWFLEKTIALVDHPLTWLISNCASQLSSPPYKNDLYLIWLVVLTITYDNVITICTVSSPSSSWLLRESIPLFNAIYAGVSLYRNSDGSGYFLPLQVLWLFLLVKFFLRLVSHNLVNKAYGLNNSKLVADYMKIEHELADPNEQIDPKRMTGYKYLVMGEAKINAKLKVPEYSAEVELPESVVTMEKIWKCNEHLLHPSIDTDNRLKDVCLSFAFFKLLKRQYFEYPAAEAKQEKTRRLVFEGLLSGDDDDRVYRVIGMEIGFLRDFFYTRYPVTFAIGFPIVHVILLIGMIGVNVWISHKAFRNHSHPESDYLTHRGHNIDYVITNILLVMIIVMEALETLFYVFSDWTKVILICRHVKSRMLHYPSFYYKVLALHCKWKFSRSLNYRIGQYSLLKNYNRNYPDWLWINHFPCSKWGYSPVKVAPTGINEEKAIVLSKDVKSKIVGSLRLLNGHPTKGVASLQRNRVYNDLAWTCALKTEFHTLIVWHIATSLCEIHPVRDGGNKESNQSIEPYHSVANHLSNYCAYLVVFLPDLLPESIFSLKLFFREILSETKEFFRGARKSEDKYNLMMMQKDDNGNKVIDKGVKLGRELMEISDDTHRWKIMSDFWSEFIVFLAPSGKVGEHLRLLESGGEFITQLWALLYHAGIVDQTTTVSSGYYP